MAIRGNQCEMCGVKVGEIKDKNFNFHHKNPEEKTLTIGSHRGRKEDIIREVKDKCLLLCKICHTKIHSGYIDSTSELKILQDNNNKIAQLALEQTQRINRLLRGA